MHESQKKAFRKLADAGELSRSYLFYGDEGVGKRTFARSLAHFLESGVFDDAGTALSDAWILGPSDDPDTVSMRPVGAPVPTWDPDANLEIRIDAIRALERVLWQTPIGSPKKIAIIEDAHLLNEKAQSALLKIVEEPPVHTLLLFITHEPTALLPPLLSRLSKIYFRRLSEEALSDYLIRTKKVSAGTAKKTARESFGRVGRALRLLAGVDTGETLETRLRETIIALRAQGVANGSVALARLLDYETAIARYQVNPKLQEKAVEYIKSKTRVE